MVLQRVMQREFTLMKGSGGGAPIRWRQGGLRAELPDFGDFYNFLMKITCFLGIIRLKFLLKNIFLISSIIQNG